MPVQIPWIQFMMLLKPNVAVLVVVSAAPTGNPKANPTEPLSVNS